MVAVFAQGQTVAKDSLAKLVDRGDVITLRALLASGANPNTPDNSVVSGWTALMAAAFSGNVEAARILLDSGAAIEAKTGFGKTAMDVALAARKPQVAELLVSRGAKSTAPLVEQEPSSPPAVQRRATLAQTNGFSTCVARVPSDSIARIKMAILEPRIQSRLPDLKCVSNTSQISQGYANDYSRYYGGPGGRTALVYGENVTIKLEKDDRTLAEASWSTGFPVQIDGATPPSFLGAEVRGEDLMAKLLHLSVFTPDDLAELAHSSIPEVRGGAAANLTDQGLLGKLARDKVLVVRKAAVGNLTDQETLARVVAEDKDPGIHKVAIKNVTDQAVLAKLATGTDDREIRRSAVDKLTDQAILAKVATQDKDWFVRIAAVRKLTDHSVLSKIATDDSDGTVRKTAAEKLR
jgi:Ankyrin repeats (3 copies)